MEGTKFSGWLRGELEQRDMGVKTLARKLAEQHPEGVSEQSVESYRATLRRYLHRRVVPQTPMRQAIAEALGVSVDEMPSAEDEAEDDELADLLVNIVGYLRSRGKVAALAAAREAFEVSA